MLIVSIKTAKEGCFASQGAISLDHFKALKILFSQEHTPVVGILNAALSLSGHEPLLLSTRTVKSTRDQGKVEILCKQL